MKRFILLLTILFVFTNYNFGQNVIFKETFGTGNGYLIVTENEFSKYDNPALFNIDSIDIFIRNVNPSGGYDEASGENYVIMDGHWEWNGTDPKYDSLLITSIDTRDYTQIHLSFGIYNNTGWGGISNHAFEAYYSTDGENWTQMDKNNTTNGTQFPSNKVWGWVTLGEELPAAENLQILIENPVSNDHTYFIDDIMLTGFSSDQSPPSVATGLNAENVGFNSFMMYWNASTDDNAVSHYEIYRDGTYLTSTTDTVTKVNYLIPGSTADYTVVAVDIADNKASESAPLNVSLESKPVDYNYSWQESHATILPEGDLEWQPKDFVFEAGSSVRYIDYENGDDSNDGQTTSTPWKHHPWDDNATDNAAACSGIHTYVFKRGVVYRGKLVADESGSPLEPIKLTSDPDWGTGKAYFFGSTRFTDGWTQADATSAPDIPSPENVWYRDVSLPETKFICEMDGETLKELHVARSPNYKDTPEDPLKSWWTWTGKTEESGNLWMKDNNNLTEDDAAYYEGATVFSQEDANVMCTVWGQDVQEWDPDNNRVKVKNTDFGGVGSKYYIENTPFLLDTTSEFFYDQDAGRLFVRLDNDKDPNTTIIEAATKTQLIEITSQHDIEISGITFGMTTNHAVRYGEEDSKSTIRMTGTCNNITIKNNEFLFVNGGISLNSNGSAEINSNNIIVSDNDFQNVGDLSIVFSSNSGVYLDDIKILRNRIDKAGYRHQGRWYSSIPAIYGQLNYGEVAGNIINESWGNGIDMFWGKGGGSNRYVPFVRGFIYQNKASNTLIGTNDYGGIESWQGGPTYCYNNYSHNASGYKHYSNSSIGYAYYFDGSFKHIVFNNIASGVSHNRNSACIMQVLGFYNMYVHNTGYNTKTFLNAWKSTLALNGHNTYLSNVAENIPTFFRHEINSDFMPFEAYAYNVASELPFVGSLTDRSNDLTLSEFVSKLESFNSQKTQTGWNAAKTVLTDAENFDFRPLATSEAIDKGVQFFSSFPLAKVVGEWNFYKHPADLSIIMGDNLYMTEEYSDRTTYKNVPKNHLTAHNVSEENFIKGDLENWTEGALEFDGSSIYCSIDHGVASGVKANNIDMTTNDFIIEAYLKTETNHTNGVIVSKYGGSAGYELSVDASGMAQMTLYESGSASVSRTSSTAINDGSWHHILAEVNRRGGIDIYIDGELDNGTLSGTMPEASVSLSNTSNLLVGKDADDNYYNGTLDFLRISKGSLYEAKTTVDELYTWQTDGPFLYDMTGTAPIGSRDAGALEIGEKMCDLTVSPESLTFAENADTKTLTVTAADGFEITTTTGDFFTTNIDGSSIDVSVNENPDYEENEGSLTVYGCNESQTVDITQAGSLCVFDLGQETVDINSESQTVKIVVNTNGQLSVSSSETYVIPEVVETNDTISIRVFSNSSSSPRTADVEVVACDGTHTITVNQEGVTAIEQLKPDGLEVYPNPVTNNLINITVPETTKEYTYSLLELTGKVVQTEKLHTGESAIQLDVAAGIYILKIKGDNINYQTQITVQ